MNFIAKYKTFLLGILSSLVVWILARIGIRGVDKAQVTALLAVILDIVQDIKTNPETKDLDDFEKKQVAVKRVEQALPEEKKSLLKKVFGSIGGAIEWVFHNKKNLAKEVI